MSNTTITAPPLPEENEPPIETFLVAHGEGEAEFTIRFDPEALRADAVRWTATYGFQHSVRDVVEQAVVSALRSWTPEEFDAALYLSRSA